MPYLTRAEPSASALRDPDWVRHLAEPYDVHRIVWDFFHDEPNSRARSFLYRWDGPEHARRHGTLWLLSEDAPRELTQWRSATKELAPRFGEGEVLRFSLRVNPVVRRNGKRHDVVMNAKRVQRKALEDPEHGAHLPEGTAIIAQGAVERWLDRRAESWGFFPVERSLLVQSYRSLRFDKGNGRRVHLGVCDLTGLLRVGDPEMFTNRWLQGFGAARAFGCGLMLLKRA